MNQSICYFTQMYQSFASLKTIYDELDGTFVCGRRSTYRFLKSRLPIKNIAKFNKRLSSFGEGNKALDSAKCIVTGSPYKTLLSAYNGRKVMVFHGTYAGLTKEAIEGLSHFDHLFLMGPRMENMFNRYRGEINIDTSTTGYIPFNNFADKSKRNKEAVLVQLGLNPLLKTVVYCPSRKKEGSWDTCAEAIISELGAEYNLVLRPHPSQSMNLRWQDRLKMRRIKGLAQNRRNAIVDLVDIDYSTLMMTADLLISDANSPAEEALYYDAPQLLTGVGRSSYEHIRQIWVDCKMAEEDIEGRLRLFECGPVFTQEDYVDWHEAVADALARESAYRERRNDYFTFVFGQRDKQAGKRVADVIRAKYL